MQSAIRICDDKVERHKLASTYPSGAASIFRMGVDTARVRVVWSMKDGLCRAAAEDAA